MRTYTVGELHDALAWITARGGATDGAATPLEQTMTKLLRKHDKDALEALVTYCEEWALEPTARELEALMGNRYRGRWANAWKYAEQWVSDHFDDSTVEELSRHVDWAAYAKAEIHDHTFVELPGNHGVFVFEDIES